MSSRSTQIIGGGNREHAFVDGKYDALQVVDATSALGWSWSKVFTLSGSQVRTVRLVVRSEFRCFISIGCSQAVKIALYEDAQFSVRSIYETGHTRNRDEESPKPEPNQYFDPAATIGAYPGELLQERVIASEGNLGGWRLSKDGRNVIEYALVLTNLAATETIASIQIDYSEETG